jgi:hypothetical protein
MVLAVAHERYATDFNRDARLPKPVSRSARNIISSGDLKSRRAELFRGKSEYNESIP